MNDTTLKSVIRLAAALCLLAVHPAAPAEESPQLVVIDLRPSEQKEGAGLTELTGKCNADVFRIADVASDPLKLDVLKDDLTQMLEQPGASRTLTVLDWSIYYNRQVRKSGGGLGNIGLQGYSLPGRKKERHAGSKCPRTESAGGWYDGAEIQSVYFPLISEFSGTFGGKPYNVRVVHSPRVKIEGKFQGGVDDTQEVLETAHETALALAEAIKK
jgi:hypothetical protein